MHAPSQPLMRSLLSQFQTPTAPRRNSRFFRVRLLFRLPCRADHSAYFGVARFISPILSAVDASQIKQSLHRCQRNSQRENEISVYGIVENVGGLGPYFFPFARHRIAPFRNSTQAPQENRMRLRPKEFCPIHRSKSCCGREGMPRPRLIRLGVQRIEDPHHLRVYREATGRRLDYCRLPNPWERHLRQLLHSHSHSVFRRFTDL